MSCLLSDPPGSEFAQSERVGRSHSGLQEQVIAACILTPQLSDLANLKLESFVSPFRQMRSPTLGRINR